MEANTPKTNRTYRTLADYAEYTAQIRKNRETMPIEQAVDTAIESCIRDGILADFLKRNKAEAKNMSIFEYDEEEYTRLTREEGREEGRKEGIKEGREEGRIANLLQNIQSLSETMDLTSEQAMDALKISKDDRDAIKPLL